MDMKKKQICVSKPINANFELLKVIELPDAQNIQDNPFLIGEYIPRNAFLEIAPGPEIKSNSLYIAINGSHLEIGYSNIKIIK